MDDIDSFLNLPNLLFPQDNAQYTTVEVLYRDKNFQWQILSYNLVIQYKTYSIN